MVGRYRRVRDGWAEIPEVCQAGHRDPDGNPLTTPAWGGCRVCGGDGTPVALPGTRLRQGGAA